MPAEIDAGTGYRRYDLRQVERALLIRRLRNLELPVPAVQEAIEAGAGAARNLIISAHLNRMETELQRTRDIVASLRAMIEWPAPAAPITVDQVPALDVIAIRDVVGHPGITEWCGEAFPCLYDVLAGLGARPSGPGGGCYSDAFFATGRGEVIAYVPVTGAIDAVLPGGIEATQLPAGPYASTEHHGPLIDFDRPYARLGSWVNAYDRGGRGPVRETYLISPADPVDPSHYLTRLSWPLTHLDPGS